MSVCFGPGKLIAEWELGNTEAASVDRREGQGCAQLRCPPSIRCTCCGNPAEGTFGLETGMVQVVGVIRGFAVST